MVDNERRGGVVRADGASGGGARLRFVAVPVIAWYAATRVVLVAAVALAVVADLADQGWPVTWPGVARDTWTALNSWDAAWMRDIVERGYFGLEDVDGDPGHWRSLAFFPLMPFAMKALSAATALPAAASGVIISVVAGAAFAFAAAALAGRMGLPRRSMILASVLATTAPMAVVMLMPYTEALFLALAAWGLVGVVDKRWGRAGLLFLLAGLTRSTALGLFIVLAVAVIAGDRRNPRAWAAVALAPLGWAAYLLWSSAQLRDAGGYFGAQARGWNSEVDGGAATLRWLWESLGASRETGYAVSAVIIVAVAATLAWAFVGWVLARIGAARVRRAASVADSADADPSTSTGSSISVGSVSADRARSFPDRWGACWPVLLFSCLAVGQVLVSDGLMHSRPRLFLSGVLVLLVFAPVLARMRRFDRFWILAAWILGSAWVGAYLLVPFPWAI
ncbi:hypothetical protein FOB82_06435 [Corynebacterium xerosis]|uniref:DUF2029 domain-containing protein n=1 Tax=Corynebacterium xerosis TaxID=1725 RepID=A0A6B8TPI0_9CORY|nr:hypothetical protein [Corynebacterium xerosis]QGS34641.1 hypothetical protein FOB82_06435 [Corynebacterium xerosis]